MMQTIWSSPSFSTDHFQPQNRLTFAFWLMEKSDGTGLVEEFDPRVLMPNSLLGFCYL